MTVLLVILAVVAVIAAVAAFVLLSPLSVRIRYAETLEVFAGLSFIKLRVFPKKEKKKTKRKKNKDKNKTNRKTKTVSRTTTAQTQSKADGSKKENKEEKKDISETLKIVFEIVKSVFDVMGKRAVIKIDELRVVVSKPDAADTAVQFGLCGGIVSNILAFTSNFGKAVINDKNVCIEPDFVSGKSSFSTDITLSITAGSLLMSLVRGYLKGIFKK